MKGCIISIGDELVRGLTVNTSAPKISTHFLDAGFSICRVITVPDCKEAITEEIKRAKKAYDMIVVTGGLGPTADDLTRQVLSALFSRPLVQSDKVRQDLIFRYGEKLATLEDQSTILEGATLYLNPLGTAPGFLLKEQDALILVLPGPPSQMEAVLSLAMPDITALFTREGELARRYLFSLSEDAIDPFIRQWEPEIEGLSIGVCPGYGVVSVYFWHKGASSSALEPVLKAFDQQYERFIYSKKERDLEAAVIAELKARKKKLTMAESCSGGQGLCRLTDIAGSSEVILGGWVSYSNLAKEQWLDVPQKVLNEVGAVSIEVARAMATGAVNRLPVDYAISITGIAGPDGGSEEKPVGTVCVAIADKEKETVFATKFLAKGRADRLLVKKYTVNFVFAALLIYLKEGEDPFKEGEK